MSETNCAPETVIDAKGRTWVRTPPVLVVEFGDVEPSQVPAGWTHGPTTYFDLEHLADAHGPLTVDGAA